MFVLLVNCCPGKRNTISTKNCQVRSVGALEALALLHARDHEQLVSCPQTLYEMYTVCTRPVDAPNPGLGLAPVAALTQVEAAEHQFGLEIEPPTVLSRWKELVVKYGVTGKSTHDARLVALMAGGWGFLPNIRLLRISLSRLKSAF